jgi:hypothetical protein
MQPRDPIPAVLTQGGAGRRQPAIASPIAWNSASIWLAGAVRKHAAKWG